MQGLDDIVFMLCESTKIVTAKRGNRYAQTRLPHYRWPDGHVEPLGLDQIKANLAYELSRPPTESATKAA